MCVCEQERTAVTGVEHASPTRVKRRDEGVVRRGVRGDDNDDVLRRHRVDTSYGYNKYLIAAGDTHYTVFVVQLEDWFSIAEQLLLKVTHDFFLLFLSSLRSPATTARFWALFPFCVRVCV